ncbi:MAG: hypothetical protein KIT69_07300, partial [Propionibacteriaceae bacterium]|nr:hypothetical protein [Propionibacteriaceae bacterium]
QAGISSPACDQEIPAYAGRTLRANRQTARAAGDPACAGRTGMTDEWDDGITGGAVRAIQVTSHQTAHAAPATVRTRSEEMDT